MNFEEVFKVLDAAVFAKKLRHLKDVEKFVLCAACQGQTYDEMATASNYRYTPSYLKQGIGPKLWKLISEVLEEEVCKTNFSAAIGRRVQMVEALQTLEPAYARSTANRYADWEIETPLTEATIETINTLHSDLEKPFPKLCKTLKRWLAPQMIQLNAGTQSRQQTSKQTIDNYAKQMAEGCWNWQREPLPVVFNDGENLFPGDGHHRVMAAIAAGVSEILVEIRHGTARDAQFYSCSANKYHGLPRTNADKRNQVKLLLCDPEWQMMSNRMISEYCNVSTSLVGNIRSELAGVGTVNNSSERVDKKGRKIQTAKIGTKPKAKQTRVSPAEKQINSHLESKSIFNSSEQFEPVAPQKPTHTGAKLIVLLALPECTKEELKEIYLQIELMLEKSARSKSFF